MPTAVGWQKQVLNSGLLMESYGGQEAPRRTLNDSGFIISIHEICNDTIGIITSCAELTIRY